MQTEKNEAAKQPPKKKEKKPPRKEVLLRKKAKNHDRLPPAEQEELDEILATEKAAHDKGALIHRLSEAADKHGRKAISSIKREVTDRVREIGRAESTETTGLQRIYDKGKADMEREMRASMQRVQETHNKAVAELQAELEKDTASVRDRYRGQYDEAEKEINNRTSEVTREVAEFVEDIPALSLESLKELQETGVTELSSEKGSSTFIVVPGQPKPA